MQRWRRAAVAIGLVLPACSPAPTEARHEGGDRRYRAVVEAAAPPVGGETLLRARVEPLATWRLGAKPPATLRMEAVDGLRVPEGSAEPAVAGQEGLVFELPLVAERAGEATLAGELLFAVCRSLLCERVEHAFALRLAVR